MGVGGMAWPVFWSVAFVFWTLVSFFPFRRRVSYGWRLYLALYAFVTVVLVIAIADPGEPSGQFVLMVVPGALIAISRLVLNSLRPWR